MLKTYYYIFYKYYKFWDIISFPKFWTDVKAIITMVVLEEIILLNCTFFYKIFLIPDTQLFNGRLLYIIITSITVISNLLIFYDHVKWRKAIKAFEKLPSDKNVLGSILVSVITVLVIVVFFTSCYIYKLKFLDHIKSNAL